jgi:hypothetical protein
MAAAWLCLSGLGHAVAAAAVEKLSLKNV